MISSIFRIKSKYMKRIIFICLILTFSISTIAQNSITDQINKDIWHTFSKAFEEKSIELYRSIHTSDLIRVPANSNKLQDLDEYMTGNADFFKRSRTDKANASINFRFLERIHNEKFASERGIYRFGHQQKGGEWQYSYGKFHVILVNTENGWKIRMDYDSNEGNTIDIEDWNAASPM